MFAESRSALFQQFENSVPAPFQQLATVNAPHSIPAPSDVAAFQPGGADASYVVPYAASLGATETTQQVFGCSGGGSPNLSVDPTLCAALNRRVAQFSTTVLAPMRSTCRSPSAGNPGPPRPCRAGQVGPARARWPTAKELLPSLSRNPGTLPVPKS